MKEHIRDFLVKISAVTAIYVFFYPAVAIARILIYKVDTGFLDIMGGLAVLYCGFLAAVFLIGKKTGVLRCLTTYMLVLVPVFCLILIYSSSNALRLILEIPIIVLIYFTGVKSHFTDVDNILSSKTIGCGIVFIATALIISRYEGSCRYYMPIVNIFAYVSMVLTFIVKNQQNLDKTFKGKHIDSASVPRNIRRYNIMIVLIIFVVTLLLFNLKDIVIVLFRVLGYVLLGVLWLVSFLMSPFSSDKQQGGEGANPAEALKGMGQGEGSQLARIILIIIFGSIVALVLYYFLTRIFKTIPERILKIRDKIVKLIEWIKRLFSIQSAADPAGGGDYIDYVETVVPEDRKVEEEEIDKYKKINNIKKGIKRLGKINDPVEKVRFTYYLILKLLSDRNININKSNTTHEIYNKSRSIEGIDSDLGEITEIYDKVRYAENVPGEEETMAMENKFNNILDELKK